MGLIGGTTAGEPTPRPLRRCANVGHMVGRPALNTPQSDSVVLGGSRENPKQAAATKGEGVLVALSPTALLCNLLHKG